jgi:hypothetical protein
MVSSRQTICQEVLRQARGHQNGVWPGTASKIPSSDPSEHLN